MEECESVDTETSELQEFQCESPDDVYQDDEDEVEELRNSLREVVQDPSVKPKLQCLMVDPSFSMVTVQSEDSGIVWETASSRCSTPWASEASSPSEVCSNEGSGAQGRITIVFDEEKVVRRRTRSSGRSRLRDRLSRPGSSRSASALGVERPEMAEVSVPNVRSEAATAEPDWELLKDKDQQLFSLISEGYEILNIRVPSKLPTVDEEESTEMQDNLSYLDETPAIKSQLSRAASQCEGQVAHAFPGIVEEEAFEPGDGEEGNAASPGASPDTEKREVCSQKDSTSDMDYFEHFTLVDKCSASSAEDVEEPGEKGGETPTPKPQAEEPSSGPAEAGDSPTDNAFEFIREMEITGDHLDEVFYGGELHRAAEADAVEAEAARSQRGHRESCRSQKGSRSSLFSVEETTLTPIFLSPGPPKIIDPILLEEPTAMSFLYSDLYEDAMGERRGSDEECSESGSVASEMSCARRLSDPGDGEETKGYLEKFILKDETPVAERPPDSERHRGEGSMMWSKSKFEMTGCLIRAEVEQEPKTEEAHAGETSGEHQPTEAASPIRMCAEGSREDPHPQEEEIGEEEVTEHLQCLSNGCEPVAPAEQITTAQGKEQPKAEPSEKKHTSIVEQTESGAVANDREVPPLNRVTCSKHLCEIPPTLGQGEASFRVASAKTIEESLSEVEEPRIVEVSQGVNSQEEPTELAEAQLTDDGAEVEGTDGVGMACVHAKMEVVKQGLEKEQGLFLRAVAAQPEAVEPETPTLEAEAAVLTCLLEEPGEKTGVVEVLSTESVMPEEVTAAAELAAEKEGAGNREEAILDTMEQASDVPIAEIKLDLEQEVDKMVEAEIVVEPQQPAMAGGEGVNTEASVEEREGSAGDTVSQLVNSWVDVAPQEGVPVTDYLEKVKRNVDVTEVSTLSEVTEKASEETEYLEPPIQSVSEAEERLATADKTGVSVTLEQGECQWEAVAGEEQDTEVDVTLDIVVEEQEQEQELTLAEEQVPGENGRREAPLKESEAMAKTEETSMVEEKTVLPLAPRGEAVAIQRPTKAFLMKEEAQEITAKVVEEEREKVLLLAAESEDVQIQRHTGAGQMKEDIQKTVDMEKKMLPFEPWGQTAETGMPVGTNQETEEVPQETDFVVVADTLSPLALAPSEGKWEERERPSKEVSPTEASELWPSPPSPLDAQETQELKQEPDEEDQEGIPGGLSTLRSFPPQEDLSGPRWEAAAVEAVQNVYEETAEELGFEVISAQELSEWPSDKGGKDGGEPERLAKDDAEDEEPLEEDYDIIDAEEKSEARAAEELQGMDWFCRACDSLLSEADLGEHGEHDVASVDDAYEDVKERLGEWISELQQRSENLEDLVSELELAYDAVEDQCRDSEAAMRAQNEEVLALLMEQYTGMSLSTEEEKKAKLEQLYDQIVSFQESIDAAKGTLETAAREAETEARSPAEIQTRLGTALESAMALELGPQGLLVFEDYAKGNSSNTQTQRKGIPVPQKPTLQPQESGSATSTSVTVYWHISTGDIVDCFQVYCMEDPQGSVSEEYRVTVKESHCMLEELDPDKIYKVWVMAVNYTGCSLPSERQAFRTAPLVPAIDTERCSVLWDSATLRWSSAPHAAAQSYTLEYCRQYALEGEGLRSISGIRGTEQKVLLQPNENYLFYIKAVSEAGASEQSEAALISTKGTRFHLLKASAHPALELSEDQSTVHYSQDTYEQRQETDRSCPSIVGEALPARGRHYWEADVSRCTAYRVGVALGTANRNSPLGESSSSWCLHCVPTASSCRFELLNASVHSDIFVAEVPERVGVLLDYMHGRLSFYNAESGQRLGTLCHCLSQPCHPALGMEHPGGLVVSMVLEVPEFAKHS